jgi:hypothetical protein
VIRLPPLDEIALRWAQIEPLLKRATDRSTCYEPIDLLRLTMAGQAVIWVAEEAGGIIAAAWGQIHVFPRQRMLEVPFIGGHGLKLWWEPMLVALDEYARATQCAGVLGYGRKGWAKYGFRVTGVTLQRDL